MTRKPIRATARKSTAAQLADLLRQARELREQRTTTREQVRRELAKLEQQVRELREVRRQERRLEEATTQASQDRAWSLAKFRARQGQRISVAAAEARHVQIIERNATGAGLERQVQQLRSHIQQLAKQYDISVSYVCAPATNAYALRAERAIEVPPVVNGATYAVSLHEIGHCARPCEKSHRPVKLGSGHPACVACELAAWQFATDTAIVWTTSMHQRMVLSLQSYARPAATAPERQTIERLTSNLARCQISQRKATNGTQTTYTR
jgi:hypothetical protein